MAKWDADKLNAALTPGNPTGELKRRMDEHRREQEEALVKVALERAAKEIDCSCQGFCRDPHVCPKEDMEAIRALASDPAAVAQIIEAAKGKG